MKSQESADDNFGKIDQQINMGAGSTYIEN
jgi:hypothetical protein